MKILNPSWITVAKDTIVGTVGINTEAQHTAINDLDDLSKDHQGSLGSSKN